MRTARDFLRPLAAACALSIASVHVAILNQHLEEKTYVGALFLAGILVHGSRIGRTAKRIQRDVASEGSGISVPFFPSPQLAGAASLGFHDRRERRPA